MDNALRIGTPLGDPPSPHPLAHTHTHTHTHRPDEVLVWWIVSIAFAMQGRW